MSCSVAGGATVLGIAVRSSIAEGVGSGNVAVGTLGGVILAAHVRYLWTWPRAIRGGRYVSVPAAER